MLGNDRTKEQTNNDKEHGDRTKDAITSRE
jgi:hypothetical protein